MKICFITDTYCDCNGVSRFLHDILEIALLKQDDVFLITSTKKESGCKFFVSTFNVKPHFAMPIPFYKELDIVWPSYEKMKKILDALKPDFIHISTPGLVGFWGLRYAKKNKIPISGTYHTDFPSYVKANTKSSF